MIANLCQPRVAFLRAFACPVRSLFSFLLACLVLPLSGCSLVPPAASVSYYVLSAPQEYLPAAPDGRSQENVQSSGPRIGIVPVVLPGYLQRPQIVLRSGNSVDVRMADQHRWGEDLGVGVARVLSIAMGNSLNSLGVHGAAVFPLRIGAPVDWRVQIDVRRFEGEPNGSVILDVLWTIQQNNATVKDGHFLRTMPSGPSMSTLVEAESTILVELGKSLSLVFRDLLERERSTKKP